MPSYRETIVHLLSTTELVLTGPRFTALTNLLGVLGFVLGVLR